MYKSLLNSTELFLTQVKYALAGQHNMTDIVTLLAQIARMAKTLVDIVKYVVQEANAVKDARVQARVV